MKWIFNPNQHELINTDTGATFKVEPQSPGSAELADYEAMVLFERPLMSNYEDCSIYNGYSLLFEGTVAECEDYLENLVNHFNAYRLPVGNGTARVYVKITNVSTTSFDIPF